MPGMPRPVNGQDRRRQRYVDQLIQRRLIILLVVMEVALVVSGLLFLYLRFTSIIEAGLYRIHQTGGATGGAMLEAAAVAILALLAVNVVALVIADRIWAHYVDRVIDTFASLVRRTGELDLRPDPADHNDHRLVDLTLTWRRDERDHWLEIRSTLDGLEQALADPTTGPEAVREQIRRIRDRTTGR